MFSSHIGILGGGQLGSMLLQASISYGLNIRVMDGDPQAISSRNTSQFTHGSLTDYDAVMQFGQDCDILTIEIEAINVAALKTLEAKGVKVYPSPHTIETIQDKWKQKSFLQSHGIPVVPGTLYPNRTALAESKPQLPGVLKLCKDGYDGRGVMMLRSEADMETAFDAPSVLENLVDIDQEIAVIVARNESGEVKCFDPVSMVFDPQLNLLAYQLCPAQIDESIKTQAFELSQKIAEAFPLVGIMAVEMFVTKSGELLVNELAPRPHNSGHHSIEGCVTSQFAQHLRAIQNLPLGDTSIVAPSVMINLVGKDEALLPPQKLNKLLTMPNVHLHWYGKGERKGRKLGHITVIGTTIAQAQEKGQEVLGLLNSES